jgi:hypothetical protein
VVLTMKLLGCGSVHDLGPEHVGLPDWWRR